MSLRAVRRAAVSLPILYVAIECVGLAFQVGTGISEEQTFGLPGKLVASVILLGWSVIGSMIIRREPRNAIGWVLAATALGWAISDLTFGYTSYALYVDGGTLPAVPFVAITYNNMSIVAELMFVMLFLLFPDGRAMSRRWAAVCWIAAGLTALIFVGNYLDPGPIDTFGIQNPYGIGPHAEVFGWIVFGALYATIPVAVVGLVVRLRRARGERRQQMRWFVYAASFLPISFGLFFFGPNDTTDVIAAVVLAMTFVGIPTATAIAIFRYHLYDIDIVINKTVVFGVLAGFISAVYVAIVVGLGTLLGTRGEPNVGLSILATAVVAVCFGPVRERVQRMANRLVYGRRATPYEVLSGFASNMASTYAADDLLPRMAEVLVRGTGAERAEVWLKVGPMMHRAAVHPDGALATPDATVGSGAAQVIPGATRSVPVRHRGEVLGVLALVKAAGDPVTPAEDDLLEGLAAQAGLVLRNVALIEELKASRQRIVAAADAERRRLERDIHDGAQQRLVGLALATQVARTNLAVTEEPALAHGLDDARTELNRALSELRDLARGIHPAILTEEGLVPALGSLAERSPVPVEVRAGEVPRLAEPVEATVYFVVSEALANIAKYARASHASVEVTAAAGALRVDVRDDGVGGADPERGSGLHGLMDRVAAFDGRFDIDSPRGAGTRLTVEVPCAS